MEIESVDQSTIRPEKALATTITQTESKAFLQMVKAHLFFVFSALTPAKKEIDILSDILPQGNPVAVFFRSHMEYLGANYVKVTYSNLEIF